MVFVTSDLHGYPLKKFKSLLDTAGFSDCDLCYILGDVIDRGADGIELLQWIMTQSNVELILGNHEEMLLSCEFLFDEITEDTFTTLNSGDILAMEAWLTNGGRQTLNKLRECTFEDRSRILKYLKNCPLYRTVNVDGKEFVLVHSGLGGFRLNKRMETYAPDELLWTRPKLTDEYYHDKTVVFGHTPTHYLCADNYGKTLITPTWINIDTGSGCGNAPMILRLNDMHQTYIRNNITERNKNEKSLHIS